VFAAFAPATLPNATVGVFSSVTITGSGGTAPTLPEAVVLLLALGLTGIGFLRLRRRARPE
jgi:hypothetical protein